LLSLRLPSCRGQIAERTRCIRDGGPCNAAHSKQITDATCLDIVNGDLIEERLLQSLRFAPSLSGAGLPFDPVLGAAIRGAISRLFR